MPRYEIRPSQPTLIDGKTYTEEDVVAYVATEMHPRDVLSMVQFGNATITDPDAEEPAMPDEADSEDEPTAGDFDGFSTKIQNALAAAGIETLAQAALYIRDHGSLESLAGIGPATDKLIRKMITDAGLPVE